MRREPRFGFFFRDDRKDLDFLAADVIEHPELVYPKPELRLRQAAKTLDTALRSLRWLMPQMRFKSVADGRAMKGR